MFLKYRIHFYWDPDRVDPLADHPCNLMRHCREPVIRLTDLRPRQAHLRGRGGISRDRNRSLEVPSWTADLLQVLNSGPFNHDQQIYLFSMFHIFLYRCTATSLSSHSYVKKTIGDPLGKSLHHWEESSPPCSAISQWRPGQNMGGLSLVDLDWLFSYR